MAGATLPPPLADVLRAGCPVLVLSGHPRGDPHSTYSWALALTPTCVRVAVDAGGATSANLLRSGRGAVQIVGTGGLNFLVGGRLRRLREAGDGGGQAALEVWELRVARVVDQSWPGVATSALGYRWPRAQAAAMRRHERAVYAALRDTTTARVGARRSRQA